MAFFLLWVTVFLMFFQPVAIWPNLAPYQPLRNTAIAALVVFFMSQKPHNVQPFFSMPTNRYFIVFILSQIVSAFIMSWSGSAIEMFNLWLRMGIVYYLITQLATDERRVQAIVAAIVLGIVYLSYFSLSKFVTNYEPGLRVGGFGWYENPNDLALILVACVPLSILLADSQSKIKKILFLSIAGMFAFNILFTGSRNGLLGLAIAGGISLLIMKGIPRIFKGTLFVILIGAMLSIGLRGILSRSDLAGGLSGDDSSENRIVQWKAGARILAAYPILGVGPGGFTDVVMDFGGMRGLMPHNTIVQVFAESGLVGGVSFIMFSFSYMFSQRKKIFHANKLTQQLFVALLGFWICALFSNRYYTYLPYIVLPLLLLSNTSANKMGTYEQA